MRFHQSVPPPLKGERLDSTLKKSSNSLGEIMHTKPVQQDNIVFNLFGFIDVFDMPKVLVPGQMPAEMQGFFV